jgi:hypothetical protein
MHCEKNSPNLHKFVSIRKEAILSVPYDFILCCRCFTVKKSGSYMCKKSAKTDKAKIREIPAPHLLTEKSLSRGANL